MILTKKHLRYYSTPRGAEAFVSMMEEIDGVEGVIITEYDFGRRSLIQILFRGGQLAATTDSNRLRTSPALVQELKKHFDDFVKKLSKLPENMNACWWCHEPTNQTYCTDNCAVQFANSFAIEGHCVARLIPCS
jgi:hypothetical protein